MFRYLPASFMCVIVRATSKVSSLLLLSKICENNENNEIQKSILNQKPIKKRVFTYWRRYLTFFSIVYTHMMVLNNSPHVHFCVVLFSKYNHMYIYNK